MTPEPKKNRSAGTDRAERERLAQGRHTNPHALLGAHPTDGGVVVRAFHPAAESVQLLLPGEEARSLGALDSGLFEVQLVGGCLPLDYRLRFSFAGGATWERDDPYRFLPTLGELDLHLISEGTHLELWRVLGAQPSEHSGTRGIAFAVWAPNAEGVSVVGDFCAWDELALPMRSLGPSGVFELFVPGLEPGATYKYHLRTHGGASVWKADPMGQAAEGPPGNSSRVYRSEFEWSDEAWLNRRKNADPLREPMSVYEVHPGSWARVPEEGNRSLSYRELAPRLAAHARGLGFTHIELMAIAEHPFDGSWGYQVSGYYAPTARYGTPDDLRFLIDTCHAHGLGVLLDWVPAHFPKDEFALARFDGSALYEHEDPQRGEHPDWGTLIFNYGRNEVRNFLVANALYWLEEFHLDGLRVDAVASMLYLDYSREEGEWAANVHGSNENLEAVNFLRELNSRVSERHPGCVVIAEESTSWPGVTQPVEEGGLGFSFKWNLGWMHDTLRFFERDPVHRHWHLNELSFAMIYEQKECFLMPLSHDEVVHGKGSLLNKLPGDDGQRFANLRLLLAYQWLRPGKQLVFMGTELAPESEWSHERSLDWHLEDEPRRAGLRTFLAELGAFYREESCLWRWDHDPCGFRWLSCDDRENAVLSFERRDGDAQLVVIFNLTPVPRPAYRVGASVPGTYRIVFSSDESRFGGSGQVLTAEHEAHDEAWHGCPQSLVLDLPPLAAIVISAPR
ncbi:MAG: 1,4-alpha-glucan branching enzyme [Planctomycetota bacterium]|jgi:1,4-alpha-glucan branching enzyme